MRPFMQRLGSVAVGVTVAIATLGYVGSSALANTAPAASAKASSWQPPPPTEAHGVRNQCSINVFASARQAWFKDDSGNPYLGLLVTTQVDIHNPQVFVGCTVPVTVAVLDVNGIQLTTLSHNAFAGAVFDPQGSDKWYLWTDKAELDAADLMRVGTLEIRM